MKKHSSYVFRPVQSDFDLEQDEYETAGSTDGDENDGYVGDEVDPLPGENPLERINIYAHEYFSESYLPDVQMRDTEDPFKNTELVLKFNAKIVPQALRWFIRRVTAKKSQGGAELLLKREPYYGILGESLVVHVTAAGWRMLEVAEKLEIKKMDYSRDVPRPFVVNDIDDFLTDDMEISDILTPAEKQIAVMHELRTFHVRPGEKHVPGYRHMKLTTGQSIFHVYTSKHLISSYFALHQEIELNKLKSGWWKLMKETWELQPHEDIRSYFGDSTCLYFNFLTFYNHFLILPAVFGTLISFLPMTWFGHFVFWFCILNMIFVTIFLVKWQRFQSEITYKWGTLKLDHWEEPRENHEGILALDPVTGQLQRKYPYYKVVLKTYGVSLTIVTICCTIAIWIMYQFLEWEDKAKKYGSDKAEKSKKSKSSDYWYYFWMHGFTFLPAIAYAIIIFVCTKIYRWGANVLTEWENHRTETQFERHLVLKMVVFEVANSFAILFYTAFVKNDIELLKSRVFIFVGMMQALMIIQQTSVPYFFRKGQAKMHQLLEQNRLSGVFGRNLSPSFETYFTPRSTPHPGLEGFNIEVMDRHDKRVQMSKVEETMAPYEYEEDFDEYLNLYLQFGYIFLFSAVIPFAAFCAFCTNCILLETSLFKRREVYQRAHARRVSSIGAWMQAFELMAVFAVMTNCALLAINEPLRVHFPGYSDLDWVLIFVLIEHAILGLQYFVKKVISKIPYKVKVAMAKLEFRSRMALKRERAAKTRKRIAQLFLPINRRLYEQHSDSNSEIDSYVSSESKRERPSDDKQVKFQKQQRSGDAPSTSKNATNTAGVSSTKGKSNNNTESSGKANYTTTTKQKKN